MFHSLYVSSLLDTAGTDIAVVHNVSMQNAAVMTVQTVLGFEA
jgi:hypothetical protein